MKYILLHIHGYACITAHPRLWMHASGCATTYLYTQLYAVRVAVCVAAGGAVCTRAMQLHVQLHTDTYRYAEG